MARILVVDMLGDVHASIQGPLMDAGWEVIVADDAAACGAAAADAIVLAADTAGVARAQTHVEAMFADAAFPESW